MFVNQLEQRVASEMLMLAPRGDSKSPSAALIKWNSAAS